MTIEGHIVAEDAYRRAQSALENEDYQLAAELAERAVELMPDKGDYLNLAGFIANALYEHDKAINYYEQALSSDLVTLKEEHSTIIEILKNLGAVWESKGEHDKAVDCDKAALQMEFKSKAIIDRYNLDNIDYNPFSALNEREKAKKTSQFKL